MHWYLTVLRKYAVFSGRAHRMEYWMFFLINTLIAMLIGFVTGLIGAALGLGSGFGSTANSLYSLAVLVPGIAVGVRRLHDSGRSGWWLLLPLVNLIMLCYDSQPGENAYGPNPKEV